MQMCGTLHVCWQTKETVKGQYLVCILYRDLLCLATAGKVDPVYTIVACIGLADVRIAEVDNGRGSWGLHPTQDYVLTLRLGLQCHTAPHSWKLIFECDHQLYEMIMTACTPKEEMEWRARLNRSRLEDGRSSCTGIHSSLDLNIKGLGTIYGKQGLKGAYLPPPNCFTDRIDRHCGTTHFYSSSNDYWSQVAYVPGGVEEYKRHQGLRESRESPPGHPSFSIVAYN